MFITCITVSLLELIQKKTGLMCDLAKCPGSTI